MGGGGATTTQGKGPSREKVESHCFRQMEDYAKCVIHIVMNNLMDGGPLKQVSDVKHSGLTQGFPH